MNKLILIFAMGIAISYVESTCPALDVTVLDEKNNTLGACKGLDATGNLFTYIRKDEKNGACCEAESGRFPDPDAYCINYR